MAAAFKPLMPLDEAWSRLHAAVVEHLGPTPRSTDVVDSFDALGRVLAADIARARDLGFVIRLIGEADVEDTPEGPRLLLRHRSTGPGVPRRGHGHYGVPGRSDTGWP